MFLFTSFLRKRAENRVFQGKNRKRREMQGSAGKCGEEMKGYARTSRGQEVDMTGKQGEIRGKRRGTERDMNGKEMKENNGSERGLKGKQRTRKPKDT